MRLQQHFELIEKVSNRFRNESKNRFLYFLLVFVFVLHFDIFLTDSKLKLEYLHKLICF